MSVRFSVEPQPCAGILATWRLALGLHVSPPMQSTRRKGWGLACIAGLVLMACAPPSAVRRTTLVPSPSVPARVGAPLDRGEGRTGLELNAGDIAYDVGVRDADMGDPGLLIPDLQLGAMIYYGFHEHLELGARLQYTRASWATRNVVGVLPFPSGTRDDFWKGGVGGRINLPFAGAEAHYPTLSLIGELEAVELPEVVFLRQPDGSYALDEERDVFFLVPNVAAQIGLRTDLGGGYPHTLHGGALVGLTTSVKNVGFDELESLEENTTESFSVGYAGLGIDYRIHAFFVNAHAYLPFHGEDKIPFGLRSQLQLGYAF